MWPFKKGKPKLRFCESCMYKNSVRVCGKNEYNYLCNAPSERVMTRTFMAETAQMVTKCEVKNANNNCTSYRRYSGDGYSG